MAAVQVSLARHATLLVEMAGLRILVDPMLGDPGSAPPVPGTPNQRPNPLVPLAVPRPPLSSASSSRAAASTERRGTGPCVPAFR